MPTLSLIECELKTGRTHQIRVHMSHKGNNILGDKKYKKRFKKFKNIDEELEKSILKLRQTIFTCKNVRIYTPNIWEKIRILLNFAT